jgi:hypothetical protein
VVNLLIAIRITVKRLLIQTRQDGFRFLKRLSSLATVSDI